MCALRAATADGRLRRSACGAQNLLLARSAQGWKWALREEEDKIQEEPGQLGVATTHHPSPPNGLNPRTLVLPLTTELGPAEVS